MISDKTKEIAGLIGFFYLDKNNGDYKLAEQQIRKLNIANVDFIEDAVVITTGRPGLLIGKKGENIEALESFLSLKIKIVEAQDDLLNYLIPNR